MDRELEINILKALACCTVTELHCYECPLWDGEKHKCRPWTDAEIVVAVRTLNAEKEGT